MFVHYLINKNDIIDFGKKIKSHDDGLMKFTLSPVSATDQIVKSSNTGNNSGDWGESLSYSISAVVSAADLFY